MSLETGSHASLAIQRVALDSLHLDLGGGSNLSRCSSGSLGRPKTSIINLLVSIPGLLHHCVSILHHCLIFAGHLLFKLSAVGLVFGSLHVFQHVLLVAIRPLARVAVPAIRLAMLAQDYTRVTLQDQMNKFIA